MSFALSALSGSPDPRLLLRPTINRPMLNRKLLKTWSPLILSGALVSSPSSTAPKPGPTPTCHPRTSYAPPFTMTLSRPGGRVLGPKNHYGQFDAHLSQGEAVEAAFQGLACSSSARLRAGVENAGVEVGVFSGVPITIGEVAYLSEYLMVGSGGVWLKVCEEGEESAEGEKRRGEESDEEFLPWEAAAEGVANERKQTSPN